MSSQYSLEEQYITELQNGSYRAFDALYTMHSRRLYSFIYRLTKSKDDTREIVQDVFIKIWLNRENITVTGSFQSYLFTVAKHMAINRFRANINSPAFVDYIDLINEMRLSGNNITEQLDFSEFRQKLAAAKKSLTETQLTIFELSKELGYSNAEVAEKLNLSVQTVKNQLTIILKILKEKLSSYAFLFTIFFIR